MSSLVARDLISREKVRRRWSLVEGVDLPLGRTVSGDQLQTPWDEQIADWHAVIRWEQERLHVHRRRNDDDGGAIFYNGENLEDFTLVPGEGFVIGRTVFQLDPLRVEPSSTKQSSSRTQVYTYDELRMLNPSAEQLEVVNELLKQLQERQLDLEAFQQQIVKSLLRVIRSASLGAVLHVREQQVEARAATGELSICQPLAREACRSQNVIAHRWGTRNNVSFPAVPGAAWAVCAPVICNVETDGDYAVYLSGARSPIGNPRDSRALPEDQLSLVAIVANLLLAVRTLHDLKDCRTGMQEFFPKPIRDLILRRGVDGAFQTEQAQAAILFCDLRGSSRFAERQSGDLMPAWERIEEALSVMTVAITDQYGCIGDFQGDAAMGFWGWPRRERSGDRLHEDVKAACQAADTLRYRFHKKSTANGPLAGFACGIGIAAGPVVAGMLGTVDQRKIGVFGPVVNLAARLESMTKQLGVSILIDQTAKEALEKSDSELAQRVRYLAAIQPAGMDRAVGVYELLPPDSNESSLPPALVRLFHEGRKAFERGNWPEAREHLARVAKSGDGPSKFLLQYMDRLQSPPKDWDGRVVLTSK
jgi:adenylate cyclase